MVQELVVGYGPNPRQQRPSLDPCMPLQVHGEQCLLYDILDILGGGAKARECSPREPAQKWREQAQQIAIRLRIAAVGGPHQLVEIRLR